MCEKDPATRKRGGTSEKEYLSVSESFAVPMCIESQKAMINTFLQEFDDQAVQGMRKRRKW